MTTPTREPRAVPPLEAGDRLTRPEFERRYEAMPGLKKAELIDGVVYLPSPTRFRKHGQPHGRVVAWLVTYAAATSGVEAADNVTTRLDNDNEPQPDVALRIETERGGRSHIDDEDYLVGGPELVCEVASSTVSYDLGPKLQTYRRHGVLEYVVWRFRDRAVDWFVLREGSYVVLPPAAGGILKSEAFPGLWLDPAALVAGDMARVLDVLRQGLGSAEHAEFRRRLGAP